MARTALAGVGIGAVLLTGDVWWVVWEQVRGNGNDGAAPLAAAACMWLLWIGRGELRLGATAPAVAGVLLALSLGMLWGGRIWGFMALEQSGALLLLPATSCLLLDRSAVAVLLAAWGALLFALPVPGLVVEHVAIPLQFGEARVVEFIALLFGFDVVREGLVVVLEGTPVRVDEDCSGFSLLWPVLLACWTAVAAVALPWHREGVLQRGLVLALAVPVVLAANLVRLVVSVVAYAHAAPEVAAAIHDGLGWLLVIAAGAAPFAWLGELRGGSPAAEGGAAAVPWDVLRSRAVTALSVLLAVALSAPGPGDVGGARADLEKQLNGLPWRLGGWVGARRALPPRELELLGADAVIHRAYVDLATGEEVLLVAAWHRQLDEAAGHNARKCYRARGWLLEGASDVTRGPSGARTERFAFRRTGQRITVFETVLDAPVPAKSPLPVGTEDGRLRLLVVMDGLREDPVARLLASRFVDALELKSAHAAGEHG